MSNHSFEPVPKWTECTCLKCGVHFWLQSSRVRHGKGRYCSHACFVAAMPATRKGRKGLSRYGEENPNWRGRRATKTCPVCGEDFNGIGIACSADCGHKMQGQAIKGTNNPFLKAHPPKLKTCHFCGKSFHAVLGQQYGKYFCSSGCYVKGRTKSPRALWLRKHLADAGFNVLLEQSWPWLHRPGIGQRMRVDLFLPDYNLAIEYDGEHHHRRANGNTEEQFAAIQDRDHWKNTLLAEHEIRLIRLKEWPIDMERLVSQIHTQSP